MQTTPTTLLPEALRKQLAENPLLGCGNFMQYAEKTNPDPDAPFFSTDRDIRSFKGSHGKEMSLHALQQLANQYAAWYFSKGVRTKDPIAVYIEEGLENLIQYVALTSLGAIPILINGLMKPEIAAGFIKKARAESVFTDAERLKLLEPYLDTTSLNFVATDENVRLSPETNLPSWFPYQPDEKDTVLVGHSSGTTGIPKAVIFHHQQFFYGIRYRLSLPRAPGSDHILSALPHSHSAGLAYVMLAVLSGTPVRVLSSNEPDVVLNHIQAFKPTMVAAFPETFVELCEKDWEPFDMSSVRLWVNGGDAAHEAHIRKLVSAGTWSKGKGSVFIDGLGSSEMGFSLFRMVHTPETAGYNRCIGTALDWVDAVIIGNDGEILPPHQVGKLGVKSPSITPGYWNDSILTNRAQVKGYWLTGDLFFQDEQKRFFHVDRIPDAIETSAGMVYSLQTEEILMKNTPELADCTIVGVPVDDHYCAPLALVRLKNNYARSSRELTQFFNEVLALEGKPGIARVLQVQPDEIPLGPTGKVLKRELREKYKTLLYQPAAGL